MVIAMWALLLYCTAHCIALLSWPGLTNCIAIAKLDAHCRAWPAPSKVESTLSPVKNLFQRIKNIHKFQPHPCLFLSIRPLWEGNGSRAKQQKTPLLRESTIFWWLPCVIVLWPSLTFYLRSCTNLQLTCQLFAQHMSQPVWLLSEDKGALSPFDEKRWGEGDFQGVAQCQLGASALIPPCV